MMDIFILRHNLSHSVPKSTAKSRKAAQLNYFIPVQVSRSLNWRKSLVLVLSAAQHGGSEHHRGQTCCVLIRSDRSMWSQYYNQWFLWSVFCIFWRHFFSDPQTWAQVPLFHETCGPGERVRYRWAVCRVAVTAVLVVVEALNGSCFCCRRGSSRSKLNIKHQQLLFLTFFYYTEDFSQKHW